eukprot:GFYU01016732.1.p1 GENE.GFYU01016732.1~~GFYU01016732.1.p1  ORF type:complete len:537 (+),score=136.18 GFYU01016732.1:126-1736(+)
MMYKRALGASFDLSRQISHQAKKLKTESEESEKHFDFLAHSAEKIDQVSYEIEEEAEDVRAIYDSSKAIAWDKRGDHIAQLPDFWLRVFTNSGMMDECLTEKDKEVLKYLIAFDVTDLESSPRESVIFTFRFAENPYFYDWKISREWYYDEANGTLVHVPSMESGPIRWKEGKDFTAEPVDRNFQVDEVYQDPPVSFFGLLNPDVIDDRLMDVYEVLKDDIWANPFIFVDKEDFPSHEAVYDAALEAQEEHEAVEDEMALKIQEVQREGIIKKKEILEETKPTISLIPDFWCNVFRNNDDFNWLNEDDIDALRYVRDVDVIEGDHGIRVEIVFDAALNPYFANDVLVREVGLGEYGETSVKVSEIVWKSEKSLINENAPHEGFFGRLTAGRESEEDNDPDTVDIADLIHDCMADNPIRYFLELDDDAIGDGEGDHPEAHAHAHAQVHAHHAQVHGQVHDDAQVHEHEGGEEEHADPHAHHAHDHHEHHEHHDPTAHPEAAPEEAEEHPEAAEDHHVPAAPEAAAAFEGLYNPPTEG